MNDSTRRGFLAVAGAGAVVGVSAAALPSAAGASAPAVAGKGAPAAEEKVPAGVTGSLVAYVSDVSSGEVVFMVEDREATVVDELLVARLAQAFARAKSD